MTSSHPPWLSRSAPCVPSGPKQWRRARRRLATGEASVCAIVAPSGMLVGVVHADGREAWVHGALLQPRRPGRVRRDESAKTITLPALKDVPSGWTCTITNVGSKPYKVVPNPIDSGVASPVSGGVDVGATDTIVRVGSGWRPRRVKLRSWLLHFDDWSRSR